MFSKQEWKLFGFAVLLTLMSRASAFVSPTFNVDDLWFWAANFDFVTSQTAFREGRFTGPFLYAFQFALGINGPRAFALSATLMAMSLAVSSILVCRIWKIDGNLIASGLVVAVLSQHPYQTDLYTWKMAMLTGGFPFVMTMSALLIAAGSVRRFLIAVFIIVLAFGIHQIPLQLAAATLVLAVPIRLLQRNFVLREWLLMVAALLVGTILYVVVAKLAIHYVPHFESVGRDKLIIFSDPQLVVERICELAGVFTMSDPLTGWLSRLLLACLLLVGSVGILLQGGVSIGKRAAILALLMAGIAIAFVCSVALTVVPVAWMPAFRNLMAINLVWAAIILVAYLVVHWRGRGAVAGVTILILLGFMGVSGEILSDQQRANSRDVLLMNRISADIEKLPDFNRIKLLAFVGTTTAPLRKLRTASDFSIGWYNYGTTLSVFSVWWPGYLVALYNEVNGATMAWADEGPVMLQARDYCKGKPSWPAREAVKSMGDWAIVCVGPYQKPAPGRLER
ncbi:glucosyltransferase domain-containing protein [Cupriavidus pauculus]|uniref:Glycosyltransferase RgtA/B/C/D-like domain-containing protein n=1 Tax=Cupriavidus pauculus TaxID=82633 RepID=A0A2N5C449_9BURK|nr:glucosyltransferase domain-containing protein [Cupriavidus pauculus]PLP96991.1 hypothetical protein CYJ10_29555 [Cupriavidus pauculus]